MRSRSANEPALPDDYRIPETDEALLGECDVQVFRATGPGGQSVNTTDSAVRLMHRPSGFVVVARGSAASCATRAMRSSACA